MGRPKLIKKPDIYLCPKCKGDLELRKVFPSRVMMLVCKKTTKLTNKKGWTDNHANFSNDCEYSILLDKKNQLETRQ